MEDKDLVTASIQAIGRCATRLPEVADSCMRTLMVLISNPSGKWIHLHVQSLILTCYHLADVLYIQRLL